MTEFDLPRLDALFERIRNQVRPPPTLSLLEHEVAQAVVVTSERREGTCVEWQTPRGPRRLQVERVVYQPEAAGRFDL
jgi:hypothetical protein